MIHSTAQKLLLRLVDARTAEHEDEARAIAAAALADMPPPPPPLVHGVVVRLLPQLSSEAEGANDGIPASLGAAAPAPAAVVAPAAAAPLALAAGAFAGGCAGGGGLIS